MRGNEFSGFLPVEYEEIEWMSFIIYELEVVDEDSIIAEKFAFWDVGL